MAKHGRGGEHSLNRNQPAATANDNDCSRGPLYQSRLLRSHIPQRVIASQPCFTAAIQRAPAALLAKHSHPAAQHGRDVLQDGDGARHPSVLLLY
jgi:hypothetical protein